METGQEGGPGTSARLKGVWTSHAYFLDHQWLRPGVAIVVSDASAGRCLVAILVMKEFTRSESPQFGVGHSTTWPSQASFMGWSCRHLGQRRAGPAPLLRSTAVTTMGPYSIPTRSIE